MCQREVDTQSLEQDVVLVEKEYDHELADVGGDRQEVEQLVEDELKLECSVQPVQADLQVEIPPC